MTTANDIFVKAIALIDEINPTTGQVDTDTTEDYLARSPYLIDILQKELAKQSRYTKVYEYAYTYDPTTTDWHEITLPTDVDYVETVYLAEQPKNKIEYYHELNGTTQSLFINCQESGTVKITYKAIPPTVTALTDVLVLDDTTLTAMPYGLAKKFVEVEQNDFLVGIFDREYQSQRAMASIKKPSSFEKITNAYGSI